MTLNFLELITIARNLPTNILIDIILIIIIATILAYVARLIKQPLIPAYIIAGAIIGPIGLGMIRDIEVIKHFSEIGIALLLFIVGLEIDIKKLRHIGLTAGLGGLIQVAAVFFAGFYLAAYLGFSQMTSVYLGLIMAFSSTMVVIKLLSDKEEINTMHGRIITGILLIQDFLVILALAILATTRQWQFFSLGIIGISLLKGIAIIGFAIVASKFIFQPIFAFAAKTKELLFLCSITVCFFFAALAYFLGFSIAIGAFVAGVGLGTLPYTLGIKARVDPIKDFFATIFFVSLGMQLVLNGFFLLIQPMIFFLLIIIILKPAVIFLLTIISGFEKKISFITAISLAQVSEFSLILVAQGLLLGHITKEIFSLTVILAIISLILTSYVIKYSNSIYNFFAPILSPFEHLSITKQKFEYAAKSKKKRIALLGCHRMGSLFFRTFQQLKKSIIVVDHNPEIIKKLIAKRIPCTYGDITSREVLNNLGLENLKTIISTVPSKEANIFLLEYAKAINPRLTIMVTADQIEHAFDLYDYGADYVILPHLISGERISDLLKGITKAAVTKLKREHLKHLEELELFGH